MSTKLAGMTGLCTALLCVLHLCVPPLAAAGDAPVDSPFPFSADLGVSFHTIWLDISDADTLKTYATLEGSWVLLPYLVAQSRAKHFGGGDFGYLWRYGLWVFEIDEQSEPFSETATQDYGTSARGWFLYAMPVLVWEPDPRFHAGLGLGFGYFSVEGDALIYDPYPNLTRIRYDLGQFAWGGYFLMEYEIGGWFTGIQGGFLGAAEGSYDYTINDAFATFGYRVRF